MDQCSRLEELMAQPIVVSPDPKLYADLPVVKRNFGDFLKFLSQRKPDHKLHIIGGAAGWIIGGNSFSDIDLAIFGVTNPYKSFEEYKKFIVPIVRDWINNSTSFGAMQYPHQGAFKARPFCRRPLTDEEVFQAYFYKSAEEHFCLSFGNLDFKLMQPRARPNLFDHEALGVVSDAGFSANFKMELLPGATNQNFDEVLDLLTNRILKISSIDEAYGYGLRVFQKFGVDGFEIEPELLDAAIRQLIDNFKRNPRFFENVGFFCVNHLSREKALHFKLNLQNAVLFCPDLTVDEKTTLLTGLNLKLNEFIGLSPLGPAEDSYMELLAFFVQGFLFEPDHFILKKRTFILSGLQFYLPKSLKESLEDLFIYLNIDQKSLLKVLQNGLIILSKSGFESPDATVDLINKTYDILQKKGGVLPEIRGEFGALHRFYNNKVIFDQNPLAELEQLLDEKSFDSKTHRELFFKCMQSGKNSSEEIRDFLLRFSFSDVLTEKRGFLRKYYLETQKRVPFLQMQQLTEGFFGPNCFQEFHALYPTTFFSQASEFLMDYSIPVGEKKPLLDWLFENRLLSQLSKKAQDCVQITTFKMDPKKSVKILFKNGDLSANSYWLTNAFLSDEGLRYLENIGDQIDNLDTLLSWQKWLIEAKAEPISIDDVWQQDLSAFPLIGQRALRFLRVFYHQGAVSEKILTDLKNIEVRQLPFLQNSLLKIAETTMESGVHPPKVLLPFLLEDFSMQAVTKLLRVPMKTDLKEALIFLLKGDIKLPALKAGDATAIIVDFLRVCPTFLFEKGGKSVCEHLVSTLTEQQILDFQNDLADQVVENLILKKGLKTKFSGSLAWKKGCVRAFCSLKGVLNDLEMADSIFALVTELHDENLDPHLLLDFFRFYGLVSLEKARETLSFFTKLRSIPDTLHGLPKLFQETYPDINLSYETVVKLKELFDDHGSQNLFDPKKSLGSIKDCLRVLEAKGWDLMANDPKFREIFLEHLGAEISPEDLQLLLGILEKGDLPVDQPFFLSFFGNLLGYESSFTPKNHNAIFTFFQKIIEKNGEGGVLNFFQDPRIKGYLRGENLLRISNVSLRMDIFKRLFLSPDFQLDTQQFAVLTTFLNKKNLDRFFQEFIDDRILVELFTYQENREFSPSILEFIANILVNSRLSGRVSKEVFVDSIKKVLLHPDFETRDSNHKLELLMLLENNSPVTEPVFFEKVLTELQKESIELRHLDWLVDLIEKKQMPQSLEGFITMQLLLQFLPDKEAKGAILRLLAVLDQSPALEENQVLKIAELVWKKDLRDPQLVAGLTGFFDRYASTLFFPGKSKLFDLAFLFNLSQRQSLENGFEKIQNRLGVFQKNMGSLDKGAIENTAEAVTLSLSKVTELENLDTLLPLLPALLAPIEKKKSFASSWCKLHVYGTSLVQSKEERCFSPEEDLQGLKPNEVVPILTLRSGLIQRIIESKIELLKNWGALRKTACYVKKSNFEVSDPDFSFLDSLKVHFPQMTDSLIEFLSQNHQVLSKPENYSFFCDRVINEMTLSINYLARLFRTSKVREEKMQIAYSISSCVQCAACSSQFFSTEDNFDLEFVNAALNEYVKFLPSDYHYGCTNTVFNALGFRLKNYPTAFIKQKQEISEFFKNHVIPHFCINPVHAAKFLKDSFKLHAQAFKIEDRELVSMTTRLIDTYFLGLEPSVMKMREDLLREEAHFFAPAFEEMTLNLLNCFDSALYNAAKIAYGHYRRIFKKSVLAIEKAIQSDRDLYEFSTKDFGKKMKGFEKAFSEIANPVEKLYFIQRFGGRIVQLVSASKNELNSRFLEEVSQFLKLNFVPLLHSETFMAGLKNEASQTAIILYRSLIGESVLKVESLGLIDQKNLKDALKVLQICFDELTTLTEVIPKLNAPVLYPFFIQIFPHIEKLLSLLYTTSIKSREVESCKALMQSASLRFLLKGIGIFDKTMPEIVEITQFLFNYLFLIEKEIRNCSSTAERIPHLSEKFKILIVYSEPDILEKVIASDEEYLYFLDHFIEIVEMFKHIEPGVEKKIFGRFSPWFNKKFLNGSPPLIQGKIRSILTHMDRHR